MPDEKGMGASMLSSAWDRVLGTVPEDQMHVTVKFLDAVEQDLRLQNEQHSGPRVAMGFGSAGAYIRRMRSRIADQGAQIPLRKQDGSSRSFEFATYP